MANSKMQRVGQGYSLAGQLETSKKLPRCPLITRGTSHIKIQHCFQSKHAMLTGPKGTGWVCPRLVMVPLM